MEAFNNTVSGASETPSDLESFREEWKRELESSQQNSAEKKEQQEIDTHKRAREYFEEGVKMEQNGNLYDAIKFYKKAVQLVPDIEREVYNTASVHSVSSKNRSSSNTRKVADENLNQISQEVDNEEDIENLIERFSRLVHLDNQSSIQQDIPNANETHIGNLPAELLNYILKWVVSADLDLKSLESCSQVCRGFYLAARDQEIWRQVCSKALGRATLSSNTGDQMWRDFYLCRARVHFNGCYISKMTYTREGERGFQDQDTYRAWHIVTYYRLIRLFPGGRMLMVLSAEDPSLTAKLMNNRHFCSIQDGIFGEYRVMDNKVICVLHKQKPKKMLQAQNKLRRKKKDAMIYSDSPDQDFLMEFQIKGKKNRFLVWSSYEIVTKWPSGREVTDTINLNDNKFPRMQFTRVGSYHFDTSAPL